MTKPKKKAAQSRTQTSRLRAPVKSQDILVTQKMLSETKSELKSDISSVKLEVMSLRKEMDSKFAQMDSKFAQMDSRLELVIAAIHRTNAIVEEQNSRNRVVLDGYDQIYRRQEDMEERVTALEEKSR